MTTRQEIHDLVESIANQLANDLVLDAAFGRILDDHNLEFSENSEIRELIHSLDTDDIEAYVVECIKVAVRSGLFMHATRFARENGIGSDM